MKLFNFLMPESWFPLIDQARGDVDKAKWLRGLIRDALKAEGVWPEGPEEKPLRRKYLTHKSLTHKSREQR